MGSWAPRSARRSSGMSAVGESGVQGEMRELPALALPTKASLWAGETPSAGLHQRALVLVPGCESEQASRGAGVGVSRACDLVQSSGSTCTSSTSRAASVDAAEQAMTTICHQRHLTPDGRSATRSAVTARDVTAAASCSQKRERPGVPWVPADLLGAEQGAAPVIVPSKKRGSDQKTAKWFSPPLRR